MVMADKPLDPIYGDPMPGEMPDEERAPRPVRATPRSTAAVAEAPLTSERLTGERQVSFWATLDKPLLIVVGTLLAVGMMMVYSTTFDWSYINWGSPMVKFTEHLRNIGVGLTVMTIMLLIDYRIWKRFAIWILLVTIGALVAVLLFGDDTFGARRSLIGGSLQPGELAEFSIIIYMAAWLSSKSTRIRSITYGLIPFAILLGIIGVLVMLQPDMSTAVIIFMTAGTMFFLAGAKLSHLLTAALTGGGVGWFLAQRLSYGPDRLQDFWTGVVDVTQANWQTLQARIAFENGGWFGVGLGESSQKITYSLPAAHTDSIFAVIGEELGLLGTAVIVLLYIAFVIRGFQIARRSVDPFGALLSAGVTVWVVYQALLNIAVMLGLVPSTGLPLPFISFGGSSLVVILAGVGLMLCIQRVSISRKLSPERRKTSADHDRSRGNRRPRLPGTRRSRGNRQTQIR
jgi:cell division protein FtsW